MHSLIRSITSRYQWIILTPHTQIQPLISSYLFLSRIIGKPSGNIIRLSFSQSWRRKHNTAHVCEFRGQSPKMYVAEARGICTICMGFGGNCRCLEVPRITSATETAIGVPGCRCTYVLPRRSLIRNIMLFQGRHVDFVAFTAVRKVRS